MKIILSEATSEDSMTRGQASKSEAENLEARASRLIRFVDLDAHLPERAAVVFGEFEFGGVERVVGSTI